MWVTSYRISRIRKRSVIEYTYIFHKQREFFIIYFSKSNIYIFFLLCCQNLKKYYTSFYAFYPKCEICFLTQYLSILSYQKLHIKSHFILHFKRSEKYRPYLFYVWIAWYSILKFMIFSYITSPFPNFFLFPNPS